jgi:hypothetical protein
VLIRSKTSGQNIYLDNRSSIEFETSSDRSLPLAVNIELQVSDRLGYSAMDDLCSAFVAYKGLGRVIRSKTLGQKL